MLGTPRPRLLSTRLRRSPLWRSPLRRLHPLRPASLLASARQAWRQSLQLRVVAITLTASAALVTTFGVVVTGLITNGLVAAKQSSAQRSVDSGSRYAVDQLNSLIANPRDNLAGSSVGLVLRTLESRDNDATVRIVPADDPARQLRVPAPPPLPSELVTAVQEQGYTTQRLYLDLDTGEGHTLYLVFGRLLKQSWGQLQLYYFFPLDEVVAQASLVANTITATGIALVIMLGAVVYVVIRMVVRPVRVAARAAQRLSNGLLDQRMEVNGEDDLAALAASFNQMAESLQRHILRLEDMSRLQRRFTSDVSHELRTPLTTVRMAADLIFSHRDEFPPEVARSAELLQAELDRFESLLTELLEISRFDAGFAALDTEPAILGPLVQRAVEQLRAVAERAGVTLEVEVPDDPVVAEVDVRRVERILRNLIGNAIEHGEGSPVRVRLAARDETVAITVRDHGVGLKPGDEKLVFNRFWRADPSRARKTGGTGLGLSISAEDARLHGGRLDAWGAPGQGAQFRLTLPAGSGGRIVASPLALVPADAWPVPAPVPVPAPEAASAGVCGAVPEAVGSAPAEPLDVRPSRG